MTEEAKKRFDVPIILIGYVTPELGEQMLEEDKADFIGMNRRLICDTELPNKLKVRPSRGHRALHPLRHLPGPVGVVPAPLPHQRPGGLRPVRLAEGRKEEEGRRGRGRPLRHGSGARRRAARA